MPYLEEPVSRETALLLREAVRRHVIAERRRRFAALVHVGRPGGREWSTAAPLHGSDHALRSDVMAALLGLVGDRPHLVWLTRPGELTQHDLDAAWLSAAASAYAEADRDLSWVVVTRRGWWDPRSGTRRVWQRMRP
ncbi:hypothetical protein [Nocardioides coralli]|uniref:hypothetical protein n=1 Tax=Nocardioides coralli TaxID=2872154 RepID=UPI001CA3A9D1|nr:hypothetical protein [Nocardioides coralli]QZY27881.1 hypothetical protein K6T13_10235 [Nocardioides coralli]